MKTDEEQLGEGLKRLILGQPTAPIIKYSKKKDTLPLKPSRSKASLLLSLKQDSALLDLDNKWMMGQLNIKDLVQIMAKDSQFCEKLFQTPQLLNKLSNEVMTYLARLHPWIAIKVIEDPSLCTRVPHDILCKLGIHNQLIATAILGSQIKYPKSGILYEMIKDCANGIMDGVEDEDKLIINKPIEYMTGYEMKSYARQSNSYAMELLKYPSARAELIRQCGIIDSIACLYYDFALKVIQDIELSKPLNGLSIVNILQAHPDLFPYVVENLHCLDKISSKNLKDIALRDEKAAAVILDDKELFSVLELKDRVSLAKRYYPFALKVYPDPKLTSWQKRYISTAYVNSAKKYLSEKGLNQESWVLLTLADDFPYLSQWMLKQDAFKDKLGEKSIKELETDLLNREEVIGLIRDFQLESKQSTNLSCQS